MRSFVSHFLRTASAAAISVASASALADTYDWTYSGAVNLSGSPPYGGSGTITTGAATNGGYFITGITGTFDGYTILGLNLGSNSRADQTLYPAGNGYPFPPIGPGFLPAYVDRFGVSFALNAPPLFNGEPAIYVIAYDPSLTYNSTDPSVCCYWSGPGNDPDINFEALGTFTLEDISQINCFLKGTRILTSRGEVDEIEYYHIELETHEVIFAEGAQVETLLVDGMTRCAPYFARNGGRSELQAMLRRLATPLIDARDPIQVAHDWISARAL